MMGSRDGEEADLLRLVYILTFHALSYLLMLYRKHFPLKSRGSLSALADSSSTSGRGNGVGWSTQELAARISERA
jgi:hypothetical protein